VTEPSTTLRAGVVSENGKNRGLAGRDAVLVAGDSDTRTSRSKRVLGRARGASYGHALLFSEATQLRAECHLMPGHELRSALAQRQLGLVFQSQIDANGHRTDAEAQHRLRGRPARVDQCHRGSACTFLSQD